MKSQKRRNEWFDNDAFWRESYPFMFPERRFAAAAETVEKALALTKLQGNSALDMCCGPGRCSLALAARGFSVTGVDRTKYLLDKARAKGRAARLQVEWIQKDMRDFVRPESYDLALSMFTSFGYFARRQEDTAVLTNIFKSLRPGGAFLMDVMGKEILAKILQPSSVDVLPDGSMMVEQRTIIEDWSRVASEWTLVRNGRTRKFALTINLYSGQELRQTLERTGFAEVQLYGNLDGAVYGPAAQRLIAIGRKPGSGPDQSAQ